MAYRIVTSAYNGTTPHQAHGRKPYQDVNQYHMENQYSTYIIGICLFRMFRLPPTAMNIDKALIVLLLDGQSQVVEVPVQKALDLINSKLFYFPITREITYIFDQRIP